MGIYYHGIPESRLAGLLAGEEKEAGAWTVSDQDGMLYLWSVSKIADSERMDNTEAEDFARRCAFESAQLTAAAFGKPDRLVVLRLEIDDDLVEDDFSCENMSDASMINFSDFSRGLVTYAFVADFNVWHSPVILSGIYDNDNLNTGMVDEALLAVVKSLAGKDHYDLWEAAHEMLSDYREYSLS